MILFSAITPCLVTTLYGISCTLWPDISESIPAKQATLDAKNNEFNKQQDDFTALLQAKDKTEANLSKYNDLKNTLDQELRQQQQREKTHAKSIVQLEEQIARREVALRAAHDKANADLQTELSKYQDLEKTTQQQKNEHLRAKQNYELQIAGYQQREKTHAESILQLQEQIKGLKSTTLVKVNTKLQNQIDNDKNELSAMRLQQQQDTAKIEALQADNELLVQKIKIAERRAILNICKNRSGLMLLCTHNKNLKEYATSECAKLIYPDNRDKYIEIAAAGNTLFYYLLENLEKALTKDIQEIENSMLLAPHDKNK